MPAAAPAWAPQTERRRVERETPPVRVVRGGRYGLRKVRQLVHRVLWLGTAALLLAMIVGVVYSQAQITQLSGQIERTRADLTNAQSTYDYLSDTMSDLTSSTNVQQIAEGRLGLIKADASQITYIQLQEQSVVEKASDGVEQLFTHFRTAALSLIGTLDP